MLSIKTNQSINQSINQSQMGQCISCLLRSGRQWACQYISRQKCNAYLAVSLAEFSIDTCIASQVRPRTKLSVSVYAGDLFSHPYKVMTFLAVVSSQLHNSYLPTSCCSVFFKVQPHFFHSGVTPWMVSSGAVPPNDATAK